MESVKTKNYTFLSPPTPSQAQLHSFSFPASPSSLLQGAQEDGKWRLWSVYNTASLLILPFCTIPLLEQVFSTDSALPHLLHLTLGPSGFFLRLFFFFSFIPHTSGQGFADIFIQTHKLGWGSQLLPAVTLLEPAVVVCVQHWAAPVTPHRHHPCSPPTPLPTLWQLNQIQLLSFVLTPSSYFMVK